MPVFMWLPDTCTERMGSDYNCKIDRVVADYDLHSADPRHESIHEGLRRRWRGEGGHDGAGYRTLTTWFNQRLLRAASRAAGRDVPAARLEYEYDALTGEDDLVRAEVGERLAADGVDVEAVREDFVSWGTMRTHLTDCLDGAKPSADPADWERKSIEIARSVAAAKVETALSSLGTKGEIADADRVGVHVGIELQCPDCPTRAPLAIARDRGYVCEDHADETGEERVEREERVEGQAADDPASDAVGEVPREQ
jgi:hypothetical protein